MVDRERKRQVGQVKSTMWLRWGAFAALISIALFARMYRLWDESIWYDEWVSYAHLDAATLPEFIAAERAHDAPMTPVYFAVEYAWAHVMGLTPLRVRLLSVLLGTGAVAMTWLLARRMFGAWAASVAGLFMALSPQQIYYAQEIRTYALVLLLALASMYALHRARDGGRGWWVLNMLANGLLVWTHLFAALLVVAQLAYLAVVERRRGALAVWFACHALLAVSLLPWVLAINFEQLAAATKWIPRPGLLGLLSSLSWRLIHATPRSLLLLLLSYGVPLLAAPALAAAFWHARRDSRRRDNLLLLTLWWLAPPLFLFVMSYLWRPCFVDRYVLYATPALYILIGAAASVNGQNVWAALLVLMLAFNLWSMPRPLRTDWKFINETITTNEAKDPYVLVLPGYHRPVGKFHLAVAPDRIEATRNNSLANDIDQLVLEENVVWLVLIEEGSVPGNLEQLMNDMLWNDFYGEVLHNPGSYDYGRMDVPGATKTSLYWFKPLH